MLDSVNAPIEVSEGALWAIKGQLEKRLTPDTCLRLGVKGSGCSGFSYVIQFDDNVVSERDITWKLNDVIFVVDKKSLLFLTGAKLNWKKSLMYTGFVFENPQESSRCGCGHSFTVK